ncbi:MAG: hypothetical protein NC093_09190 [Alistipes sp.]|nr:hypothetical protein [Alistipes sp.]
MKISDVKRRLGTYVKFTSVKHHICSDYILTGCIIRKDNDNNFYYLAELNDSKQQKCTLLVRLEEIE